MSAWPPIDEPELLERLAMDERKFDEYMRTLAANLPPRLYDEAALERALGYPWVRPVGSYRLQGDRVELLADLGEGERERTIAEFDS